MSDTPLVDWPVCGQKYHAESGAVFTPRMVDEGADQIAYTIENCCGLFTVSHEEWLADLAHNPAEGKPSAADLDAHGGRIWHHPMRARITHWQPLPAPPTP